MIGGLEDCKLNSAWLLQETALANVLSVTSVCTACNENLKQALMKNGHWRRYMIRGALFYLELFTVTVPVLSQ